MTAARDRERRKEKKKEKHAEKRKMLNVVDFPDMAKIEADFVGVKWKTQRG